MATKAMKPIKVKALARLSPFIIISNNINSNVFIDGLKYGVNDFWIIPGIESYPESELFIYNRWGDLVFEVSPYMNEWEGQTNKGIAGGNKLVDGAYFYVLNTNRGLPIKGTIELKTK